MPERYKEEIEDILAQHAGKLEGKHSRARAGRVGYLSGLRLWKVVSPGRVLLASVVLLITGLLVRGAAPGIMGILFWLGLLTFITAYAMFFVRWGNKSEHRWRGKPIDDTRHFGWLARLRRQFRI